MTGSEWLNGLFIEDCGLVYVRMMNKEQTEVEDDSQTDTRTGGAAPHCCVCLLCPVYETVRR